LLILLTLAALLLAADWWICLPEGAMESATYVGRQVCAECHEKECKEWTGSDHDLAMDEATPATVLGDFNDRQFTHIAIEDVVKLSDHDVGVLLEEVDVSKWAIALVDAGKPIEEKILGNLSEADQARLRDARRHLQAVRPCDVTDVQQEIDDVLRRLKKEGRITVDFAVTSKLFRRGDDFFVTTDNRDGRMETFRIKYTFGVWPLQQYLVEFPDGRVQCLPIAWDSEKNRWFHLYPKEPIPHDDALHWTRPLQNWNYMCAECHSTNLQKNYNLAENSYHTTFSEIDVSCEACHGPGSVHVKLARRWDVFWDRRYGYGLPRLAVENPRVEIESCAPCHARRRVVYPGGRPGEKLLDHYLPEILDNDLYYADGQILEEDYVYGSFIQSLMYSKGVRCTNCHDSHTTRVKFRDPQTPRTAVPDNRLCSQSGCHVPANYDTVSHHHHPDASKPGTRCVECHMPQTKYMVVDPRRDHSLRVPRPDLTVSLGIPNACNLGGCHDPSQGETAQWAAQQCEKWYGKPEGPPHFAHAIAAGREGKEEGRRALAQVARRKDLRPIVRASAISLLSRYGGGTAQLLALEGLRDPEELVRAASVRSLQNLSLGYEELCRGLAPMLDDPIRAVRAEAARILSAVPRRALSMADAATFDAALAEYMKGQEFLDDQPAAHLNMAVVYTNQARLHKALQAYQTALRLDPRFVPARINLAMLYDQLGEKDKAESQFRKVVEIEPNLAEAQYSLGLLLAEDEDRLEEASEFLGTAARLAPENPRVHYNYGLALQKLGRLADAEKALKTACKLSPETTDYLYALAILCAQQKSWGQARSYAEGLLRIEPANPQWRRLLGYIQKEAKRLPKTNGGT
jgi:tetratricopeptide (TPR) repeat protein